MPEQLTPENVANLLKSFMKKKSMNGKEMANAAGISEQAFSGYLRGKNYPAFAVLMAWAGSLRMNVNWLLTGQGPMTMDEQSEGSPEVLMLLRENRELRIELERAQKGKQSAVAREKTATAAGEKRASAG